MCLNFKEFYLLLLNLTQTENPIFYQIAPSKVETEAY